MLTRSSSLLLPAGQSQTMISYSIFKSRKWYWIPSLCRCHIKGSVSRSTKSLCLCSLIPSLMLKPMTLLTIECRPLPSSQGLTCGRTVENSFWASFDGHRHKYMITAKGPKSLHCPLFSAYLNFHSWKANKEQCDWVNWVHKLESMALQCQNSKILDINDRCDKRNKPQIILFNRIVQDVWL